MTNSSQLANHIKVTRRKKKVNLEFLGDALDYWKGSIFLRLQKGGLLKDFSADPMLTDPEDWYAADFELYADLLQIRPNQIFQHKIKLR
jgi:hypothetical protein